MQSRNFAPSLHHTSYSLRPARPAFYLSDINKPRRSSRGILVCAAPDGTPQPSSSGRITDPYQQAKDVLLNKYTSKDGVSQQQQTSASSALNATTSTAAAAGTITGSSTPERGSWEWWTAYFNLLDDAIREAEGIESEIQEAVEEEDYAKAAALKSQMKRIEQMDSVHQILQGLENALQEERYADAAVLRDAGGAGLLGWWIGKGEEDSDECGHLLRITPDFGRYVAHAYTGREIAQLAGWKGDLATVNSGGAMGPDPMGPQQQQGPTPAFMGADSYSSGSSNSNNAAADEDDDKNDLGAPVFEVFVKPEDDGYLQLAAALHAPVTPALHAAAVQDLHQMLAVQLGGSAISSIEEGKDENGTAFIRINLSENDDNFQNSSSRASSNEEEDDGINSDERQDEEEDENDKELDLQDLFAIDQLASGARSSIVSIEDLTDKDGYTISALFDSDDNEDDEEDSDEEEGDENTIHPDDNTISEMGLGAVLQRCPAELTWTDRDTFVLQVEAPPAPPVVESESETTSNDTTTPLEPITRMRLEVTGLGSKTESVEIEASSASDDEDAAGEIEELEDEVRSKARATAEIFNQLRQLNGVDENNNAPMRLGLEGINTYKRLVSANIPRTDSLAGTFIGSFGPHGPEVIQVSRQVVDGEEWAYGMKLTGDENVPAGEVSFRAKIGKAHRLPVSSVYPPEIGVMQRYAGQGRVAQTGYTNPKWVEGELITLTASNPLCPGATLGFLFSMDRTRKFLVFFTKIHLDDLPVDF